ncbi:hypothetical protein DFH08DRAFT_962517 [Mycena albidolilacea]|uniref:Mediator complex subunit 16 C-terminal domain-containing protein n=1 Tax=Mycena albidolilacea TaxID=1033008 RepID=A0AAD6ZX71_9AGAR|nr:hypothetical protein DFH08DRAFT_962517 [Mycena albidolilacea]
MLSPSKGKAKEETQWSSGWWEYHALLDQTQRPVAWSSTSTIFSAHPTQPLVAARHFSSSKQFVLPSPGPILSSLGSYEPPAVISVSPSGEWLFAYFPSGEIDGLACLWHRGAPLDVWGVKEWWTLNRGAGIVAASWLGSPREWTVDDAGSPALTETRWVTICYLRQYVPSLRMISCPLYEPASCAEGQPNPLEQVSNRPGSVKVCTRAAIGLAYNEHSIMVATRSRVLPSCSRDNSLHLNLPLTLEMPPEPELAIEWETWGEDSCIELCEVRIDWEAMGTHPVSAANSVQHYIPTIFTTPLPALHGFEQNLANLTFIPTPPNPSGVMESSPDNLYLAASYLDFGDYTSTPKSELILHSLSRVSESAPNSAGDIRTWTCRHAATRSFTNSVLTFIASSTCGQTPTTFGLFAGIMNSSGPLPREKTRVKEIAIGITKVLKLPDLTDHERWEPSHIMSPIDSAGRDLPLNAVLSFNNSMLLCNSLSSVGASRISLHVLPKLVKNTPSLDAIPPVSLKLATSLLSGTSTTDLSHLMTLPSVSLDEVGETLFHALILAENGQDRGTLTWRALGLILEIYRTRALRISSEAEREILDARWQTALDMCSLASCNTAFEDCKDDDGFDLDAVWQLVGLSAWAVGFVEKLVKECILSSDLTGSSEADDDLFESSSPIFQTPASSVLLHLAHPSALKSLHATVSSIARFKNNIGSLSASEENSQIAKSVLTDLIDCAGVDLDALEPVLAELLVEAKKFGVEETRRSLALCEPTSAMGSYIKNAIEKVTNATIVNKPRLFIKPSELMDGVPHIFDARKDKAKDIISKGTLGGRAQGVVCLRCGSKSEVGGGMNVVHASDSWRAWEKLWVKHCICAGIWVLARSP